VDAENGRHRTAAPSRASPHSRRCSPISHRSPGRVRGARGNRRNLVGWIWFGRFDPVIEQIVELGGVVPRDLDFEVQIQVSQSLQLDFEDLLVPTGQLGQPVVGNHIGPALGIGQMIQANRGNPGEAEALGRLDAAVAGDDAVSASTRIGLLKPNLPIEATIWVICLSEWVRALPA
jgi:hypothetical protein